MHDDEVDIDPAMVRRLLLAQFPQWSELPISAVQSTGTVNAIYRLGEHLGARLPRVKLWAQSDADAATAVWVHALEAPARLEAPVWIHTDLLRPNLLVHGGRLCAVIDFGGVGVGDPAAEVIAAWSGFGPAGRAVLRGALGVDEGRWIRARGFALHQAALIIPYYRKTNPGFVLLAKRTVEEVLAEYDTGIR